MFGLGLVEVSSREMALAKKSDSCQSENRIKIQPAKNMRQVVVVQHINLVNSVIGLGARQ